MPTAPFRLFGFGPDGTPVALVELMADPAVARRMDRSHHGRSLALAAAEVAGLPDATLRGLARALDLINIKGRATPDAKLKAAMGLPPRLTKVGEFVEAVARDAVALAVALLGERTTPELAQRTATGKWRFSNQAMADLVGVSRNMVVDWRRCHEYRDLVPVVAERIIEAHPAGLSALTVYQARVIAAAVPRDDLLSFVGGGPVPELALPDR